MTDNNLMDYEGPRTPFESEWDAVTELCRSIFFKDSPTYEVAARTWPMSLRSEAREDTFAMFHKGHPVSAIERLERDIVVHGHTLRIGYVGSVCTNPDYRKLGLASTVLSATMKRFHEDNVDFVDISGNREMYKRAGSRYVGGLDRFILHKDKIAATDAVTLRSATMDDVKTIAWLNQQEPIRSIRPLNDYEIVINYGHCVGRPVEFVIVYIGETPAAYLLITKLLERDNRKYRRVMEYAGDRQFIVSALAKLTDELPEGADIEIDVQKGDLLGKRLSNYDIASQPAARSGTHCILDFARTMTKLKPFFASYFPEDFVHSMRFSAGNERYNAWCKDGSLKIEGVTNMVWTILGTPSGEQVSNIQATGLMQELVDLCLPVPLPPLEMNMI